MTDGDMTRSEGRMIPQDKLDERYEQRRREACGCTPEYFDETLSLLRELQQENKRLTAELKRAYALLAERNRSPWEDESLLEQPQDGGRSHD